MEHSTCPAYEALSMKHSFSSVKAVTFLCLVLFFMPFQTFAAVRVAACFEKVDDDIENNRFLEEYTKIAKCFEVEAVSFSAENNINIGSLSIGGGAGKATFGPLSITKKVDANSPGMFLRLVTGRHYDKITFMFFNVFNDKPQKHMELELHLAMLQSINTGAASGEDYLSENIEFQYGAVKISVIPYDERTGEAKDPVEAEWSRVLNKATTDTGTTF